jgi:hypothetical protein
LRVGHLQSVYDLLPFANSIFFTQTVFDIFLFFATAIRNHLLFLLARGLSAEASAQAGSLIVYACLEVFA